MYIHTRSKKNLSKVEHVSMCLHRSSDVKSVLSTYAKSGKSVLAQVGLVLDLRGLEVASGGVCKVWKIGSGRFLAEVRTVVSS